MIKSRNGRRIIYCSFCDATDESEFAEFTDCINEWKEAGWRMFKNDDAPDWKHICPDCRKANKSTYRRQKEEEGGGFD